MRIISESESEIKGVDNEKNIMKAGSCFIIVFKFGSHRCLDYYTKRPLERTQKNFLFRLTKNCTVTIFWCLSIFALNPTSISENYTIQDRFLTYNNFKKKKRYIKFRKSS